MPTVPTMIRYIVLEICFAQLFTRCLATQVIQPSTVGLEENLTLLDGRIVYLSTRGSSAFRIRFKPQYYFESPMLHPEGKDVLYHRIRKEGDIGIATNFGSVLVNGQDKLVLQDSNGKTLTTITLSPSSSSVSLTTDGGLLYGHGAGVFDSRAMTSMKSVTSMTNTETYVPHYYSSDGYAALGVVKDTVSANPRSDKGMRVAEPRGALPVNWTSDSKNIVWTYKGDFELYLMPAADLNAGTMAYYDLIGRPKVPPRYAFGFLASRWGWKDQAYIMDVLKRFREDSFPLDAVIFDFEFFAKTPDYKLGPKGSADYSDFGFNELLFPHPKEQLKMYQEEMHVRVGAIRKPRLGNSSAIEHARKKGWIFPLNTDLFHGRFLDFANPEVRNYNQEKMEGYADAGIDFWWNDEGEANYYTYYWWNTAEINLQAKRSTEKRFFSINRAFSPGMARLGAAVWTGDIATRWELLGSVPGSFLNFGLAGAPYVACDIGGFTGQWSGIPIKDQKDLLTRWYQLGTYMPIMRVHSAQWTDPHFPWMIGNKKHEDLRRAALELRYKLVPYHYSLAHRMYTTGQLWMQPMALAFPDEKRAWHLSSQWMDGSVLVSPVTNKESQKNIQLPDGVWYEFGTCNQIAGPREIKGHARIDEIPAYVQAGTVVPLGPVVQHTDALPGGPLEVQIYTGASGEFELVEDDGETKAYESGQVRITQFTWDDRNEILYWKARGARKTAKSFTHVIFSIFSPHRRMAASSKRPLREGGVLNYGRGQGFFSNWSRLGTTDQTLLGGY